MAEYSRIASGKIISTGGNTAVVLPYGPQRINIFNATQAAAASGGVSKAWWNADMGQGAAGYVTTSSGPADGSNYISAATGGGFSTFQGGIALQYGPSLSITAMTKSNSAPQITTSTAHNLVVGNVVVFQNLYQTSSTGQVQLCNIPFVVSNIVDGSNFNIAIDNNVAGYTALSSPLNGTVKQVLYPNLYAPGVSFIAAISLSSTTTITTTAPNNFVIGQEIAFRIPPAFGTVQLNSLPNVLIPGSPVYGFVIGINSSTQFVVNINSSSYTAFSTSQPFASVVAGGFSWPQVLAVGDANSGSLLTNFQPPSFYNGSSSGLVNSINGPALAGAYCNNTSQGFIIGASIAGAASDVIYWDADLCDYLA